ncbi:MAG: beta-lactamase family protein [Deltaproteobacteria bacterium]|nr:beta-lactamase family protein [Deltaproteobacteria bacterium]
MELPSDGYCDARFAVVRDEFVTNLEERGDVGAAVAVSVGGRVVVDLWGGWADAAQTRAWQRDSLVNFFSVSKGLTTLCVLQLVDRGLLDLDAPVARVWPELAQQGKDGITLREVLSHRAGLPAIREILPDGAMLAFGRMTRALESETPWWPPGSAHGYHVNTFGYLAGEVVRRVAGKTIGAWLRENVAGPLGADVHIGLPQSEHERVAEFLWPPIAVPPGPPPPEASDDERMRWATYWNPPGLSGGLWVNTAAWRSAEIPSTNGHGTARGVARVYAALAKRGTIDGVHVVGESVIADAAREHSSGVDRILQRPSRFGVGFQLTQPERPLGPNAGAFGHFGTGGSVGFCDPEADVAFGYVMNDLGPRWQNPRNRALIDSVYASL